MRTYDLGRAMLPYCIVPLKDGTHLLVNRYYKPLGVASAEWVDYDTHPSRVKIKGLTAKKADAIGLSADGVNPSYLYLYSDSTNPEHSAANATRYGKIVGKLFNLDIEPV